MEQGKYPDLLISEKKFYTFAEPPAKLILESGQKLGPITVAYESWGQLNRDRSNAILVLHALTGDSHAAGKYSPNDRRPGWWDPMIGPGKAIDTDKYFVLCANILGGCQGTTGPSSVNPETGKPYGSSFPVITLRDMVKVQRELLAGLGIEHLVAVLGASMGGMQALEWAIQYPDFMDNVAIIATSSRMTAQGLALNLLAKEAIMNDPNWCQGDYYGKQGPDKGLALARMVGMITYQSNESMDAKFGREINCEPEQLYQMDTRYEMENYLHYQGKALVKRFDANSYIYLCKAMDLYDVGRGFDSLADAFNQIKAKMLVMGINSDILFPTYQQQEIVKMLNRLGKDVTYSEIDSPYGHDAFLIEFDKLIPVFKKYLESV